MPFSRYLSPPTLEAAMRLLKPLAVHWLAREEAAVHLRPHDAVMLGAAHRVLECLLGQKAMTLSGLRARTLMAFGAPEELLHPMIDVDLRLEAAAKRVVEYVETGRNDLEVAAQARYLQRWAYSGVRAVLARPDGGGLDLVFRELLGAPAVSTVRTVTELPLWRSYRHGA